MSSTAKIQIEDKTLEFPVITGTENEKAIDTRLLRSQTGYITFDEGYGNTGSCQSNVTFIDGEKGILRHRGYSIEDLAENSTFIETSYLVIYGELPTPEQHEIFRQKVRQNANINEGMRNHFKGFPSHAHPMAILSSLLNGLGCYYPTMASNNRQQELEHFDDAAALLISKVRTIAAISYRIKEGLPINYSDPSLKYSENFLHMMFSDPYAPYLQNEDVSKALDLIFLLHADHEQNCSTSTVRMVASGGANLFASVSAGVCALWGPLHGGANMAVIKMLNDIHAAGDDGSRFIEDAKNGKSRLMGFGHRVYKNYDPRARILGKYCEKVLAAVGDKNDPILKIARKLEQMAMNDSYFSDRKLYPNVDFYSGIILRAIGLPLDMFTVIFAIGRMPGWIAHWREIATQPKGKIHRPRQIYTGPALRSYQSMDQR